MIIYHASDPMMTELAEPIKVLNHFKEAQQLALMGYNHHLESSAKDKVLFDIYQFFHALTQMKNIFGTCKIHCVDTDSLVSRTLEINLTESEETWIKKRFSQIQEQFLSVVPNRDFIQETFDLLGKGIPVSKRYSPQWMVIVTERVRRVLKMHPGVNFINIFTYEIFVRMSFQPLLLLTCY